MTKCGYRVDRTFLYLVNVITLFMLNILLSSQASLGLIQDSTGLAKPEVHVEVR